MRTITGESINVKDLIDIKPEIYEPPKNIETCEKCGGVGFILRISKSGCEQAVPCECLPEKLLNEKMIESEIPKRFRRWELSDHKEALEETQLAFIQRWIQNIGNSTQKNSLLLMGNPGSHKTSIACSILKTLMRMNQSVYFSEVSRFLEDQKETFGKDIDMGDTPVGKAKNCGVFCLDDVGSEYLTKYSIEPIWTVIDYRYAQDLPTIYTTNFTTEKIKDFYMGSGRGDEMGLKVYRRIAHDSVPIFVQGGVKA